VEVFLLFLNRVPCGAFGGTGGRKEKNIYIYIYLGEKKGQNEIITIIYTGTVVGNTNERKLYCFYAYVLLYG
jgi:hypothetical protein